MSELWSMLLPLDTLAGWPEAPDPTPQQVLGLLFGIPLIVIIIVSGLIEGRAMLRARHAGDNKYTDPTWLGAKAGVEEILGDDNAAGQAALQGGPAAGDPAAATKSDDRGGASARW